MTEEFTHSPPPPLHWPGANAADERSAGQDLWQACAEQLARDLPEAQFNTWIKPLVAHVAQDFSKITLLVGNRFKLDWIRAQYASQITALLGDLYGQPMALELALAPRESVARTAHTRPSASGPPGAPAAESA
ncbi:chromosomal replication initiator protein DnaA, partial [Verminephrobacter sp. Larva24]